MASLRGRRRAREAAPSAPRRGGPSPGCRGLPVGHRQPQLPAGQAPRAGRDPSGGAGRGRGRSAPLTRLRGAARGPGRALGVSWPSESLGRAECARKHLALLPFLPARLSSPAPALLPPLPALGQSASRALRASLDPGAQAPLTPSKCSSGKGPSRPPAGLGDSS